MMAGHSSLDTALHNEMHMSHSYDCDAAYMAARLDIVNLLLRPRPDESLRATPGRDLTVPRVVSGSSRI